MSTVKSIIKTLVPKVILNFVTAFFYGWKGNYSDWSIALNKTSGYDADNILEKVKESSLKVKREEVTYERDSVIFDKKQYSYPVLSSLMWIAAQNNGRLNVIDFGGSLGSSYYQNKEFLDSIENVKWNIVEQANFVKVGKELFENNQLRFYDSIGECVNKNEADVILLSSVLQYLEKPYDLLNQLKEAEIKYIIIDRTPFINGDDRITIQKVHPKIYKAKYPCWFFNKLKFISYLEMDYDLIIEFDSLDRANIKSEFKGYLFNKK